MRVWGQCGEKGDLSNGQSKEKTGVTMHVLEIIRLESEKKMLMSALLLKEKEVTYCMKFWYFRYILEHKSLLFFWNFSKCILNCKSQLLIEKSPLARNLITI